MKYLQVLFTIFLVMVALESYSVSQELESPSKKTSFIKELHTAEKDSLESVGEYIFNKAIGAYEFILTHPYEIAATTIVLAKVTAAYYLKNFLFSNNNSLTAFLTTWGLLGLLSPFFFKLTAYSGSNNGTTGLIITLNGIEIESKATIGFDRKITAFYN